MRTNKQKTFDVKQFSFDVERKTCDIKRFSFGIEQKSFDTEQKRYDNKQKGCDIKQKTCEVEGKTCVSLQITFDIPFTAFFLSLSLALLALAFKWSNLPGFGNLEGLTTSSLPEKTKKAASQDAKQL